MYNFKALAFTLLIGFSFLSCQKELNEDEIIIYIVRHAEKADNSTMQNVQDPDLSEAGYRRAEKLSTILEEVPINSLYSTNYIRTRKTLEPISIYKNLDITLYKASEIGNLLDSLVLFGKGKNYLISGHSNTILPTISYLNGVLPQPSISENEYDKLFKVIVNADTAIVERTIY